MRLIKNKGDAQGQKVMLVMSHKGMESLPQTLNSVKSNNLSLKYQRFTPAGCKEIGIIKIEFLERTNSFKGL